jgi:hypothetical protein
MRLAPIALVLLTSFALVTAIPIDTPDEVETTSAERGARMTKLGHQIVRNPVERQKMQEELKDLAEQDAIVRIPKKEPPKPGSQPRSKAGVMDFYKKQIAIHDEGVQREKARQEEADHSMEQNPDDGFFVTESEKARALHARHAEFAKEYRMKKVRTPLFFAQRWLNNTLRFRMLMRKI